MSSSARTPERMANHQVARLIARAQAKDAATAASLVPTRAALKLDPMTTLRYD